MESLVAWMRGDYSGANLPRRMFWIAFAVRVLFMTVARKYQMRAHLDHFEFGWEMGRVARALATGYGYADPFNGHSGPTAWVPPLYPLLLGGVFKLFGIYSLKSGWVILAINSLLSAAIAPAVYEIGWRCFGRNERGMKIALWSGWLWALYPAAIQYAIHWVWEMSLSTALFSWIFVIALRVRGIGSPSNDNASGQTSRNWGLFGVLWGLLALSNSSLLTFLPFCGLWMIWPEIKLHAGRSLRNAVLAGACCGIIVTPWIVRNWFAFHAFVPMRANFGAELFESVQLSNRGFPWMATLSMAEKDPDFQRYERLGEVAYSKEQGERANVIIREHPEIFWAHALQRVYFFWASVPHPIENKLLVEVIREANFSFISLGGLLGLALALRRRIPGAWLFFWAFLTVPFVYYFVTVQARFRHPLEPMITVLTVYLFQSAELPWAPKQGVVQVHS
ncbi:hypothetical protein FTO74_14895 [Granulicella sp. WH15]|nr:hypothetical protein FTO74_14895 [Granulicella sp. WH15]